MVTEPEDLAIVGELEKLLNPCRSLFAVLEANRHQINFTTGPISSQLHSLAKHLFVMLQTHPVFSKMPMRFFGQKQLTLGPQLAMNLIQVALDRSAPRAVEWLHHLYLIEKTDVRFVAEVHGLEVGAGLFTLPNGIQLMPLQDLPPSANAQGIIEQYHTIALPTRMPMFQPIGATLVIPQVNASAQPADKSVRVDFEKAINAFTLLEGCAPVVGISWLEFVDQDVVLAEHGRMWHPPSFEGLLPNPPHIQVNAAAVEWIRRYLNLKSEVKDLCDLAIARLNLARRRRSPGDKAIEGGICLEALLGDADGADLTYKLKLRSALLLANDFDARDDIRTKVGAFYTLRSKTVHGRSSSVSNSEQVAKDGLEICGQVLQAIVKRNEKPKPSDWEILGRATD